MNLWIAGQWYATAEAGQVWEFAGVFDSQEAAISACRDARYFYAPAILNEIIPHESEEWLGVVYPIAAT